MTASAPPKKPSMAATDWGKVAAKGEFIADLVSRIQPTVEEANRQGKFSIDEVTELHVQDTINEMLTRSAVIAQAVKAGKLAVVGANYKLVEGDIHPLLMVGNIK